MRHLSLLLMLRSMLTISTMTAVSLNLVDRILTKAPSLDDNIVEASVALISHEN